MGLVNEPVKQEKAQRGGQRDQQAGGERGNAEQAEGGGFENGEDGRVVARDSDGQRAVVPSSRIRPALPGPSRSQS